MGVTILDGDCRQVLKTLPAERVQCVVTSPPYYGLRDYGASAQIGQEASPEDYVDELVAVFRETRRVLRNDGTLWVNLGDSYGKGKQLLGIPWRVAFALQQRGWVLRSSIIWSKPNPMPESVKDRPTRAHENLFLFAKSTSYFYDAEAVRMPLSSRSVAQKSPALVPKGADSRLRNDEGRLGGGSKISADGMRNARDVWTVTPRPFQGAHFAVFPPDLIAPCIKAGCPAGGTVLDPFMGSGTTGLVAQSLGRDCIGIELNPAYAAMARNRIAEAAGLFEAAE